MRLAERCVIRAWLTLGLCGLLAGCASLSDEPRSRYGSLAKKPLSDWNAADALATSRPAKETVKPDQLSLKKMTESVKKATGLGPNPDLARRMYADAEAAYAEAVAARERDAEATAAYRPSFVQAANGFTKAAERWPDSGTEEDGLFFAGESYFFAGHYYKANELYEKLLKKYPNSRHLDRVEARRFVTAQYWVEVDDANPHHFYEPNFTDKKRPLLDTRGHAVRVFDRIRLDDPTGKLADDATLAAGNAKFAKRRYLEADSFYKDLQQNFPSSEHQFSAHLLGLKAKLLAYEGPDYSGVPLDEAEKLIHSMRKNFPRDFEEHREYLTKSLAEVRFKKAERAWFMAQFFDRRRRYGAAKMYYRNVLTDHGDVPSYVAKAQERLAQLEGLPDEPAQPLPWLTKLFPRAEKTKPLIATSPSIARRR